MKNASSKYKFKKIIEKEKNIFKKIFFLNIVDYSYSKNITEKEKSVEFAVTGDKNIINYLYYDNNFSFMLVLDKEIYKKELKEIEKTGTKMFFVAFYIEYEGILMKNPSMTLTPIENPYHKLSQSEYENLMEDAKKDAADIMNLFKD